MTPRGNTLKLTAVSALVVLTLTGFSTGRGNGSGDGGDGGGCSSSSQNHDSSSGSGSGSHRDYDDDDDNDDTGSSSGGGSSSGEGTFSSLQDATVELLTCVSRKAPYATVEVANPNTVDGTFTVEVTFDSSTGGTVVTRTATVDVPAGGTATARVEVDDTAYVSRIHDCIPTPYATATR